MRKGPYLLPSNRTVGGRFDAVAPFASEVYAEAKPVHTSKYLGKLVRFSQPSLVTSTVSSIRTPPTPR
jgi:hypothetical protein